MMTFSSTRSLFFCQPRVAAAATTTATAKPVKMAPTILEFYDDRPRIRSDHCWCCNENHRLRTRTRDVPVLASASPFSNNQMKSDSSRFNIYLEVLEAARTKFTQEISLQSKDISLAKALLYVAAEDEAFMAFNREMDAQAFSNERRSVSSPSDSDSGWDSLEEMPLAGRNISQWMSELDAIAKEVEVELLSRDIGCHLIEVLEAVNVVLLGFRGFKRISVPLDSNCSYLHSVLSYRHCSGILLSIIYIEVCQRLGVTIVGSPLGEDFLIWPQAANPEELFKATSGRSLFAIVNGSCVENPRSRASDLTSSSLVELEIASNRDIIGIALANLIRFYWKRASRLAHGLMLTSPLRSVTDRDSSNAPLLRPQDLRLATMASDRLLILQPHNWALRRDHGMMLYFSRKYKEAIQELSICVAFAPEEESAILEPFIEKLHLLVLIGIC